MNLICFTGMLWVGDKSAVHTVSVPLDVEGKTHLPLGVYSSTTILLSKNAAVQLEKASWVKLVAVRLR